MSGLQDFSILELEAELARRVGINISAVSPKALADTVVALAVARTMDARETLALRDEIFRLDVRNKELRDEVDRLLTEAEVQS